MGTAMAGVALLAAKATVTAGAMAGAMTVRAATMATMATMATTAAAATVMVMTM